jgi:hypothetical protein
MVKVWLRGILVVWLALGSATLVQAASSSSNFKIDEDFVGGGGLTTESSASFQAGESIGDVAVGQSSSTNFQINGGYTTTSDPALTFIVTGNTPNFGPLSTGLTNFATSTFRVINYTSYGYIVTIGGTTPVNAAYSYSIPALATPTSPAAGTEQYGINLVANTGFGTDPTQSPDATFSFGVAQSPDYNQPNKFKFVSGDTIASAPKSSGATDFTISHILNVKTLSPAGTYNGSHELICVGTY